eukprot:5595632-Pleurochrysis_carterae.AAC.2
MQDASPRTVRLRTYAASARTARGGKGTAGALAWCARKHRLRAHACGGYMIGARAHKLRVSMDGTRAHAGYVHVPCAVHVRTRAARACIRRKEAKGRRARLHKTRASTSGVRMHAACT